MMGDYKKKRVTIDSFDSNCIGFEKDYISAIVNAYDFVIFLMTDCANSFKLKQLLDVREIQHKAMYIDNHVNGSRLQENLEAMTDGNTTPYIFVKGQFIGGYDEGVELITTGLLQDTVNGLNLSDLKFDLVVIGGGTSGLAAAMEAAKCGKKVALCDSFKPTATGTVWGLGGSPAGNGSPSKLIFHRASLLRHDFLDSAHFGWESEKPAKFTWSTLANKLSEHMKSMSWMYRKNLREVGVQYFNGWARFKDNHTISLVDSDEKETELTSKSFIIATGTRHRPLEIRGEEENSLPVEDMLSLTNFEGSRILIIGTGPDGIETAGILSGLGFEVSVVVRRRILPRMDEDAVAHIKTILEAQGVKFIENVTVFNLEKFGEMVRVEGTKDLHASFQKNLEFKDRTLNELGSRKSPPPLELEVSSEQIQQTQGNPPQNGSKPKPQKVETNHENGGDAAKSKAKDFVEDFHMVIVAAGRKPNTTDLGLHNLNIKICPKTCKIKVNAFDQTSVENIFAVGQVSDAVKIDCRGLAQKSAQLLVRRMYRGSNIRMDYRKVPTLLQTPVDYAFIGDTEESAKTLHGQVEVYHSLLSTPKSSLPNRFDNRSYVKVICVPRIPTIGCRIVGIHLVAPNAGEILQGFVPAFVNETLTKENLDDLLIPIVSTNASVFSELNITKSSGAEIGLNII